MVRSLPMENDQGKHLKAGARSHHKQFSKWPPEPIVRIRLLLSLEPIIISRQPISPVVCFYYQKIDWARFYNDQRKK